MEFFKDEVFEYIFYLTELDGRLRCKFLNITEDLYYDMNKLTVWYLDIMSKIILCEDEELLKKALLVLNIYIRARKAYFEDLQEENNYD